MLDNWVNDLRHALRALRSSPTITLVSLMTLAVGIGALTAVFTVIDAVLLEPLPYERAEEIAVLWTDFGPDLPQNWLSGPEYVEIREFNTALEEVAVISLDSAVVSGRDDPEELSAAVVSGSLFSVLGANAQRGRLLGPADDAPQADLVAVISDGLWRRRFGADPQIIGRHVTLDDRPFTVVGVLPAGFALHHPNVADPGALDLWLPLQPTYATTYEELGRGSHFLLGLGLLRHGDHMQRLRADLDAVAAAMREANPDVYGFDGWGLHAYSLHDDLVEEQRGALVLLLGAVALVLLIACVNVANLQLTRATVREREIAVRAALGAGRIRLLRQLAGESLLLAAAGAGGGLAIAHGLVRGLVRWAPQSLPRVGDVGIDLGALGFVAGIAVLTAVVFGLAPGLSALRVDTTASLKAGGRGAAGSGGARLRAVLVVAEVSLALVLAVGAGLLLRSFNELSRTDPGYDTESLLTMRITLPASYQAEAALAFWEELLADLRAAPRVLQAGAISQLPLSNSYSSGTTLAEQSELVVNEPQLAYPFIEADRRIVTDGYFETMGMRVLRGRSFTPQDTGDTAPVAIVDEEFARRFWGDEEPIGKRIATEFSFDQETMEVDAAWREVVGVVRHSKHYDLATVGREQAYVPVAQRPMTGLYVAVRGDGDAAALAPVVRDRVRRIDGGVPISDLRTMRDRASRTMAAPRFQSMLFGAFAGTALMLAAIGIYGVMAFSVGQRVREIGVRMALGADRSGVRRLVLGRGLTLATIGIVIGLGLAFTLVRFLEGMLFGVSPSDPATYLVVAAVIGVVAAAASWIPAVRATRIEPVEALRSR